MTQPFVTGFKVYPNPTADILFFEISTNEVVGATEYLYHLQAKCCGQKVAYKGTFKSMTELMFLFPKRHLSWK